MKYNFSKWWLIKAWCRVCAKNTVPSGLLIFPLFPSLSWTCARYVFFFFFFFIFRKTWWIWFITWEGPSGKTSAPRLHISSPTQLMERNTGFVHSYIYFVNLILQSFCPVDVSRWYHFAEGLDLSGEIYFHETIWHCTIHRPVYIDRIRYLFFNFLNFPNAQTEYSSPTLDGKQTSERNY